MIPPGSVANVQVRIGIHSTMKALKELVESLDTDRLYEGLAVDLETLATRIRERLGVTEWASVPSGISQELRRAYLTPALDSLKAMASLVDRVDSSQPNVTNTPKAESQPDGYCE